MARLNMIFWCLCTAALAGQTGPAGIKTSAENSIWLKADAGTSSTTNNAPLSAWNDQSGNGLHVTQTVTAQQPSFAATVMNGMPAVRFDDVSNTNDKLTGPDSPLLDNTQGYTFFMVSRPEHFGDARVIISKRTGVAINQSFMHFFYNGNRFNTDIQTNNNRYQTNFVFTTNNNYAICQQFDGTLAAALRCRTYVNGNLDFTASETNTMVPDNASPLVIGSTDATDGRPFGGYMSEIIIYRVALSEAERIIVDNYLSAKYGINLSANDKYAGDLVASGDYDFGVAGVGQESGAGSNSFSPSVSGGLGLSVNSGLENGDYILAGHQAGANATNNSDVGGMTGTSNARWQRVWYLDVTNASAVINCQVSFDLSEGGMTGASPAFPANYVLLYRAGQSGNWTELATATSLTGDQVNFSSVTFTADGYYTIGTQNISLSTLPVDIVFFSAETNEGSVVARWQSAMEHGISRYLLEKSADGKNFASVTEVAPAGSGKSYEAVDRHPFNGVSYYRLAVAETNTTRHLQLVAVNSDCPGIEPYPNPADQEITVRLKGYEIVTAELRTADGRLLRSFKPDTDTEVLSIETSDLPDGIYHLSVGHRYGTLTRRVAVRH